MQVKTLLVQPRPSAVNMTLPAFAADSHVAVPLLLSAGACCRSISPAQGALGINPAARRLCCRSMVQTDRGTDVYYADSVNSVCLKIAEFY